MQMPAGLEQIFVVFLSLKLLGVEIPTINK